FRDQEARRLRKVVRQSARLRPVAAQAGERVEALAVALQDDRPRHRSLVGLAPANADAVGNPDRDPAIRGLALHDHVNVLPHRTLPKVALRIMRRMAPRLRRPGFVPSHGARALRARLRSVICKCNYSTCKYLPSAYHLRQGSQTEGSPWTS